MYTSSPVFRMPYAVSRGPCPGSCVPCPLSSIHMSKCSVPCVWRVNATEAGTSIQPLLYSVRSQWIGLPFPDRCHYPSFRAVTRWSGNDPECARRVVVRPVWLWSALVLLSGVLCRLLAVAAEQALENHESLNVWFVASFFPLLLRVIHRSQICKFFWSKLEFPGSLTGFCTAYCVMSGSANYIYLQTRNHFPCHKSKTYITVSWSSRTI